jgi:hypothetical protein
MNRNIARARVKNSKSQQAWEQQRRKQMTQNKTGRNTDKAVYQRPEIDDTLNLPPRGADGF